MIPASVVLAVFVLLGATLCSVLWEAAALLAAKRRLVNAETDHIIRRAVEL